MFLNPFTGKLVIFLTWGVALKISNYSADKSTDEGFSRFDRAEAPYPFVRFSSSQCLFRVERGGNGAFSSRFGAYPLGTTGEILLAWKELSGISSGWRAIRPPPCSRGRDVSSIDYLANISGTSPPIVSWSTKPAIFRNKFKYCKIIANRKKDEDALYFDQNVYKKKKN